MVPYRFRPPWYSVSHNAGLYFKLESVRLAIVIFHLLVTLENPLPDVAVPDRLLLKERLKAVIAAGIRGTLSRHSDRYFSVRVESFQDGKPAPVKSARRWLKWNDLIPVMHPLQIVVWAVEAAFALFGVWKLLKP